VPLGAKAYGYSVGSIGHSIGALIAIGIAFRIIAIIILVSKSAPKQYAPLSSSLGAKAPSSSSRK
jgi:hypothetical protein